MLSRFGRPASFRVTWCFFLKPLAGRDLQGWSSAIVAADLECAKRRLGESKRLEEISNHLDSAREQVRLLASPGEPEGACQPAFIKRGSCALSCVGACIQARADRTGVRFSGIRVRISGEKVRISGLAHSART